LDNRDKLVPGLLNKKEISRSLLYHHYPSCYSLLIFFINYELLHLPCLLAYFPVFIILLSLHFIFSKSLVLTPPLRKLYSFHLVIVIQSEKYGTLLILNLLLITNLFVSLKYGDGDRVFFVIQCG